MTEIIELGKTEQVPIGKWYQLYGPPFTKDPIEDIIFSFKRKFGHYPDKIYVTNNGTSYCASHRGKPKRRKEDHEEI